MPREEKNAGPQFEGLRALAARWSDARVFVVTAAFVFALLLVMTEIGFWPALLGFAILLLIVLLRQWLGEADQARTSHASVPLPDQSELARGTGLAVLNGLPDPLIVLDRQGRVLLRNKAAVPIIGALAKGKHIAAVLRSADVVAAVEEALQGGPGRNIDYRMPVPVERHYDVSIMPIGPEAFEGFTGGQSLSPRDDAPKVLILLRDLTEARRVEAMRVDFVAFASHELKTPLASMSGFIDTLRGHAKDDPEAQARFLDIMSDQAGRMRRLIDDLLSLSRIELREHVRPDDIVNLPSVINDVVDGLNPVAAQSGLELVVDLAPNLPLIRGDRNELAQVVQNLADNALRYGRAGKRVEISLASETRAGKDMLRLSVRDFGEGIAREHLPRLTERFYRVDAAASRAKGGTGLGLAIVKHIVSRHQGMLAIESELGKGSVFNVFFPVAD